MRICLYWNATAGDETPLHEITRTIEAAGHHIARVLKREDDVASAMHLSVDALVAAGGDGTVARAARALAGSEIPIAILPLGTANNIATSLSINDDVGKAVAQWHQQRITRIDLGVVTDERGDHLFVEGTGVGLMPAGIRRGRGDSGRHQAADAAAEVTWARGMFLAALEDLRPQPSSICVDGETIDGDFLLVEVLNIASIGPRLRLSAETAPADGLLSAVIAAEDDREAIRAHLQRPWDEDDNHAWLKSWRAKTIEVAGWHDYHVDDQIYRSDGGKLEIGIRPGAVAVLA